jgi:S-adenosylmethionine hydrolase
VCAVVDPGVGSSRRAILAVAGGRTFVGPDNGILSCLLAEDERPERGREALAVPAPKGIAVHDLCSPQFRLPSVSATFHGRDLFAPAAAHLAAGVDFRLFGPPIGTMLAFPPFCGQPGSFGERHGYVVHVDRFGNLITTIRAAELFPRFEISVGGHTIDRHVRTFSGVGEGQLLCHVDSSGYVAIAAHKGDAAAMTGARRGDPVTVRCL